MTKGTWACLLNFFTNCHPQTVNNIFYEFLFFVESRYYMYVPERLSRDGGIDKPFVLWELVIYNCWVIRTLELINDFKASYRRNNAFILFREYEIQCNLYDTPTFNSTCNILWCSFFFLSMVYSCVIDNQTTSPFYLIVYVI